MALDTASVQQPGFNIDLKQTYQQERATLDNSAAVDATKSIVGVLQKRQDELKDSFEKMGAVLEETDARDQSEFLSIIEANRDELKALAKRGVNNREYIAAKAKMMSTLAAKKAQSETFSTELSNGYKEIINNPFIKTEEAKTRLNELATKKLSERNGKEVQSLLADPNIYRPDMIAADAIKRTVGPDVKESYAYKVGKDVYKGTVVHSPLIKIKKYADGSPVVDKNGDVEFEANIPDEMVSLIMANAKMPGVLKSYIDLVNNNEKLKNDGAGEMTLGKSFTNAFKGLAVSIAGDPDYINQDIKLGSSVGGAAAAKDAKEEENIARYAELISGGQSRAKELASAIGAGEVQFVSYDDEVYITKDYKGNLKLSAKGKPEQRFEGLFITEKDGKTSRIDYDESSPGTLAATLYKARGSNISAGEKENKAPEKPKEQSLADRMKAAAKNKKK